MSTNDNRTRDAFWELAVGDALEAALWSAENSSTFAEAVLNAVNLGDDADSVGAMAEQIAGARYGMDSIPAHWLGQLAQREYLEGVCERLATPLGNERYKVG